MIFGCTVTIINMETEETGDLYRIVGDDEAGRKSQGKISYQSPIARALIGKESR